MVVRAGLWRTRQRPGPEKNLAARTQPCPACAAGPV